MTQFGRNTLTVCLVLFWFLLAPLAFVTLYTLIELQSAARAAAGTNASLASYLVIARAHEIEAISSERDKAKEEADFANLAAKKSKSDLNQTRRILENSLMQMGANTSAPECASAQGILICASKIIGQAQHMLNEPGSPASPKQTESAEQARVKYLAVLSDFEAKDALATSETDVFLTASERYDALVGTNTSALNMLPSPRAAVATVLAVPSAAATSPSAPIATGPGTDGTRTQGVASMPASAAAAPSVPVEPGPAVSIQPPPTPVSTSVGRRQAAPAVNASQNGLSAVALSFNAYKFVPGWQVWFELPAGVVVALFTGLMGAVGAVVASLLHFSGVSLPEVEETEEAERTPTQALLIAFATRPLIGGLAGFMVFFVVSAGAAFLVQPGAGGSTEAINSLSPAALASLGVFAGLASTRALQWLTAKAVSFFEVPKSEKPSAGQPQSKPSAQGQPSEGQLLGSAQSS